jgi:CubicO group peptidase (beta-lactamase class C family)
MSEPTGPHSLDDVAAFLADRGVAGLSLAYSVRGRPVVTRTWGVASIDDGSPITADTIFRTGSLTKIVTAYAVLRLAADGRLDMDADVNSILTSWRLPAASWDWRPVVTPRMLLAHVAGVSTSWHEQYASDEEPPSLLDELNGRARGRPIRIEALPGLHWFYSGGGYQVLAQMICDVTALSYSDAVAELVLKPLGMSASTAAQTLPADRRGEAARGHIGGSMIPQCWHNSGDTGASGLWTTPTDLVRLGQAINSGAVPEMLRGHPVEPRMALGPMLTDAGEVEWWSHGGSPAGYECMMAGTGPGGFAVAVMANSGGWHDVPDLVFRMVADECGPGAVERTELFADAIDTLIEISADQEDAVGRYRLPNGSTVDLIAPMGGLGPELHLVLPGQSPVRLWPGEVYRWWIGGIGGTQIRYEPPDELTIMQFGSVLRGVRIDDSAG